MLHCLCQISLRGKPIAFDGGGGEVEDLGGFFNGEAAEVAQFDEAGFSGETLFELVESAVEVDEGSRIEWGGRGGGGLGDFTQGEIETGSALGGGGGTGMVDEDAADEVCGDREEMGAVLEVGVALIDQTEVGFVNELGGLDELPAFFAGQMTACNGAKFVVNDRDEPVECAGIAFAPLN